MWRDARPLDNALPRRMRARLTQRSTELSDRVARESGVRGTELDTGEPQT